MKHRLAKILQERGTSTRLAEKTGMKPSVISELCSGKIRIHEGHIDMICDALNIPAWHLFADPDEIFPEAYKELISAYLSLDEDDKRVVDKFMFPHKQQPCMSYSVLIFHAWFCFTTGKLSQTACI